MFSPPRIPISSASPAPAPAANCAAALDAALTLLLADPLVRQVMAADRLSEAESLTVLRNAALALARHRAAAEVRR